MTARQCIATLCLVALLPSCTTFKTYDGVPPGTEGKVRVTLDRGGAPILLHDAQQMGDQYVGGLDGRTWFIGCEDCSIRSIPIDSIARFEINEVNAGGTAWAAILGTAVLVGALYALFASSYEFQLGGS